MSFSLTARAAEWWSARPSNPSAVHGLGMAISAGSSLRDIFEGAAVGHRTPASDGSSADEHAPGDESEDASRTIVAQEPGDGEAADDDSEAAPRVDEADGAGADASWVKL